MSNIFFKLSRYLLLLAFLGAGVVLGNIAIKIIIGYFGTSNESYPFVPNVIIPMFLLYATVSVFNFSLFYSLLRKKAYFKKLYWGICLAWYCIGIYVWSDGFGKRLNEIKNEPSIIIVELALFVLPLFAGIFISCFSQQLVQKANK